MQLSSRPGASCRQQRSVNNYFTFLIMSKVRSYFFLSFLLYCNIFVVRDIHIPETTM